MKYLFTIAGILFLYCQASAQYDPAKVNKKSAKLYESALANARNGDFIKGIANLNDAIKIDKRFLDAYLSMAGMYGEMKNYQFAADNYARARAIDSLYFKDYSLPYSINLAGLGQFEKALAAAEDFLSIKNLNASSRKAGEYRKLCYTFAVEYARLKPLAEYKFQPENMGDSINSNVSEYFPTITLDGSSFVYTRRVNNSNEDFYESTKTNHSWSKSRSLSGNINTNDNEGAQNISQDGQWLIFTGCNFPEGFGSCDLYISYLSSESWSEPENMGRTVNTEAWESAPSLSSDKRDLYFTSTRAGGFGGSDLYISHRLSNGSWSEPENAGPEINTAGDESCPFIHADNQTLYFTSNGRLGYGGEDLFMIKKTPGNSWSTAVNLGYPINTIENEGSMVIAADGKTAYYASDRSDSRGGLDLYTFELRSDIRPLKTVWVKGKVFNAKTNKGLPSAVELTDLSTREVLSRIQTDETGNYLITLPTGKDYAFNVNRKGYLFFSENFPLSHESPDSTYHIDIPLHPLEENASVILKNIFFDVGRFELRPESSTELDNLVKLLNENPGVKIVINGHTDNTGKAADNFKLSNDRAGAVIVYLISKGINSSRLSSKGLGSTTPIAGNDTEEGRARNRRTELKVMK